MSDTSFDNQFISSQYINFYPYVGKDYVNSLHRILLLGESHYGSQTKNSNHEWSRDVVERDFLENYDKGMALPYWARCHRNTANVLAGTRGDNPHTVYDEIAFYNFFQRSIGEGKHEDKRYLTSELKMISEKALAEVMNILKPDLIIGWGWDKLEWSYLPYSRKKTDVNKNCAGIDLHFFTLDGFPSVPIWCMHHPSEGLKIDAHRQCLSELKKFLGW